MLKVWDMTSCEEWESILSDLDQWEEFNQTERLDSIYDTIENRWKYIERWCAGNTRYEDIHILMVTTE